MKNAECWNISVPQAVSCLSILCSTPLSLGIRDLTTLCCKQSKGIKDQEPSHSQDIVLIFT